MALERFLVLSAVLFSIGLYGALSKRNAVTILMAIELMFNAVNIALVALSKYVAPAAVAANPASVADDVVLKVLTGQVFAVFIITVAAAEVALGLGIIIAIYRNRGTVDITDINLLKH